MHEGSLTLAGYSLAALAEEHGTPLYLYDRATMDAAAAALNAEALGLYQGPGAAITYAGKAYLCKAIAEWVESRSLWLDCTGETEIRMALSGGVSRGHILVHGVNKSPADLDSALLHAGTIVADNLFELERLVSLYSSGAENSPILWLRLLPGTAVQTHHAHTQTGQHGSKFGMTPEEALQAAEICHTDRLPLVGLHFHLGSNFRDPAPLAEAIDLALDRAVQMGFEFAWHFSPGGGWGAAYHEEELPHPDVEDYIHLILELITEGCCRRSLPLPWLHLEPGRSLIARAGVALYRIGAVKRRGNRTWLLVDGGMTDNPRHAMYGAKYSALPVSDALRTFEARVDVAGPLCESGDVILEDLPMPQWKPGRPACGADERCLPPEHVQQLQCDSPPCGAVAGAGNRAPYPTPRDPRRPDAAGTRVCRIRKAASF